MRSESGALGGAGGATGGLTCDDRGSACANRNDATGVATRAAMDFPSTRSVPRRDTNAWGLYEQQPSPPELRRAFVVSGGMNATAQWCAGAATAVPSRSADTRSCACDATMPTLSMQRARQADSAAGDADSANARARLVSRRATNATFRVYPTPLTAHSTSGFHGRHQSAWRLSRSALPMTETELRVMAALAIMGLRSSPNAG